MVLRIPLLLVSLAFGGCLRGGYLDRELGSGGGRDGSRAEDVRLDRARDGRDAGADRPLADAGACRLGNGCEECEALQNPACTKTCPGSDCDDLPAAADPWPEVCNPVLFSDAFEDPSLSRWLVDHDNQPPGVTVPSCGRLRFTMTAQMTRWVWPRPDAWPPSVLKPGFLVEVLFRAPTAQWYLQLYADAAEVTSWTTPEQRFRKCELSGNPAVGQVMLRNQVRVSETVGEIKDLTVDIAPGTMVRLQSWVTEGKAICRVSFDGETVASTTSVSALPAAPGLVLGAINPVPGSAAVDLDVDWIRVFNHD